MKKIEWIIHGCKLYFTVTCESHLYKSTIYFRINFNIYTIWQITFGK